MREEPPHAVKTPSDLRFFFGTCLVFRFEDFVRKEQKNVNPDEEVMADSSEMKLKQVRHEGRTFFVSSCGIAKDSY